MDVLIRDVRLDDAEAIVRILNPIIEAGTYTILDTPLTAEDERRYIAGLPERAIFHVAQKVSEKWHGHPARGALWHRHPADDSWAGSPCHNEPAFQTPSLTLGGDTIVGFQTVEPFAGYTRACDHVGVIATFVDLEHRRQGIGTRLFEATFGVARHKGYEKMFTYVRADNPAALRAYRKCGFRIIGTAARHAKIGGHYVDEILIEKFL